MTDNRSMGRSITEEVADGIYQIKVPLPNNPLGSLNAYLLTGGEKNLLIDTGFFHPECRNAIVDGFQNIGAKISDTDIFLTHLHADHSGLASELAARGAKIYCSALDGNIINLFAAQEYWDEMGALFCRHGMPDLEEDQEKGVHPGKLFGGKNQINFITVVDGELIQGGKYKLQCVWTPGHTPGHLCLYEKNQKLLFSGDHVLGDITPVLSPEQGLERPLRPYLESLQRIEKLEIREILPGHRGRVTMPYVRIEELKKHHELRLEEIRLILRHANRPMNAYEVAAKMSWRMPKDIWEKIPRQQRWFATGEAIAHLFYLEEEGSAAVRLEDGSYTFSLSDKGGSQIL
ncbi:MAG: hypothetical protein K0Q48_1450 [Bacillota bacterium]|nr:hypothetical protein [Bacillota bacterium]